MRLKTAGSRTRERRDPRGNTARQCLGLLAKIVVQVAPVLRLSLTRRSLLTSRRMPTGAADLYVRVSGSFSHMRSNRKNARRRLTAEPRSVIRCWL
jgi:hypothetical protein